MSFIDIIVITQTNKQKTTTVDSLFNTDIDTDHTSVNNVHLEKNKDK